MQGRPENFNMGKQQVHNFNGEPEVMDQAGDSIKPKGYGNFVSRMKKHQQEKEKIKNRT